VRQCLFCKAAGSFSREHIIPRWLLDELGIGDAGVLLTHGSLTGETVTQRSHTFENLVNGVVCPACNNGWMSQLEGDVMGLLKRMIHLDITRDNGFVDDLIAGRDRLARWAVKTAAVFNRASNYRRLVPDSHFEALYAGTIPDGVIVGFGFIFDEGPVFESRQSQQFVLFDADADLQERVREMQAADDGVYKVSLRLKHLLLKVAYMPFEDVTFDYEEATSYQIWPYVHFPEDASFFEDIDEFDLDEKFYQFEEDGESTEQAE
jgi:hypothetical protein